MAESIRVFCNQNLDRCQIVASEKAAAHVVTVLGPPDGEKIKGASKFHDDDDGGELEHEAVNLYQPNGNDGFLAPEIRLIA